MKRLLLMLSIALNSNLILANCLDPVDALKWAKEQKGFASAKQSTKDAVGDYFKKVDKTNRQLCLDELKEALKNNNLSEADIGYVLVNLYQLNGDSVRALSLIEKQDALKEKLNQRSIREPLKLFAYTAVAAITIGVLAKLAFSALRRT